MDALLGYMVEHEVDARTLMRDDWRRLSEALPELPDSVIQLRKVIRMQQQPL